MLEIEKKYLVNPDMIKHVTDLFSKTNLIRQSYISISPEVRIRKRDNQYFLTRKSDGTQTREEIETEINSQVYNILESLTIGNVISKTRGYIELQDNLIAEVDKYEGALEGLYTVEVEFKSEQQAKDFITPEWFGREITFDKRYKNKSLSQNSNPVNLINESYSDGNPKIYQL